MKRKAKMNEILKHDLISQAEILLLYEVRIEEITINKLKFKKY